MKNPLPSTNFQPMKKLILLASLVIAAINSFSQENERLKELHRISSQMMDSLNRKAIKDTNQVVMFAYKVRVAKQSSGSYKIISSSVSDSVAFLYYPRPGFLKTINYHLFTQEKAEATFVLPMALIIGYPTNINPGLVDINSFGKGLVNFLYVHDEKSNLLDTSNFIYLPIGIINTTSAVDY